MPRLDPKGKPCLTNNPRHGLPKTVKPWHLHPHQAARNLYLTNQQAHIPLDQAIRSIVESIEHNEGRFITSQIP